MAEFRVIRAGRKNSDYAERLITNMFMDKNMFFRKGYGVCDTSPELVIYSFDSVRNTYYKINQVKVQYMELLIEDEVGVEEVMMVADRLGRFFYESGFQSFIGATDTGAGFVVAIVLNSVSFSSGQLFYDNNTCYWGFYQYLCQILPRDWTIDFDEEVIFEPSKRTGNYVHGRYA